MKTIPAAPAALGAALFACSTLLACGPPFTADYGLLDAPDAPLADAAPDAEADAPLGNPRPDAGAHPDAPDASDDRAATSDAASDAGASEAAAPTCTLFSAMGAPDPTVCSGTYAIPGYYAIVGNAGNGVGCWPQIPTPAACLCKETYDCACVEQAAGCTQFPGGGGGKTWGGCTESAGGEITVTCN